MKFMSIVLGAGLLVLAQYCGAMSDDCKCSGNGKRAYCSADFGIRARILEELETGDGTEAFKILIKWKFKGKDSLVSPDVDLEKVIIAEAASDCYDLKVGKNYLISGKLIDGMMVVTPCNWVERWGKLSKSDKKYARKQYKKVCYNNNPN